jgi:hypothetical protein
MEGLAIQRGKVIHPRNGFGFRGRGSLAREAASCAGSAFTPTESGRIRSYRYDRTRSASAYSCFPSPACVVGLELLGFFVELLSNDGGHQGIVRKISGVEYNFRVRPKKPVVRILVIVEESHAPHLRGNRDLTGQRQGRGHFGNPCLHKTNLGG